MVLLAFAIIAETGNFNLQMKSATMEITSPGMAVHQLVRLKLGTPVQSHMDYKALVMSAEMENGLLRKLVMTEILMTLMDVQILVRSIPDGLAIMAICFLKLKTIPLPLNASNVETVVGKQGNNVTTLEQTLMDASVPVLLQPLMLVTQGFLWLRR